MIWVISFLGAMINIYRWVFTQPRMTLIAFRNVLSKCKRVGVYPHNIFLRPPHPGEDRELGTSLHILPPLPVPPLPQTIENFLKFAEPVQSDLEFRETINLANRFLGSKEANELQQLLEERGRKLGNWLTPWWLNIAYLAARTPLPIVTSPGITFPKFEFTAPGIGAQLECAAKIVQAALKYHHRIISDELTVDKGPGGVPFDMSQYKLMYGTTRIPKHGKDVIRYGKDRPNWARHILVTRDGHTFAVPVYNNAGNPLGIGELVAQLRMVVERSGQQPKSKAINIVSSDEREVWAAVYERIRTKNPAELCLVEDALFVMSLDRHFEEGDGSSAHFATPEDRNMAMALHGGGSRQNANNRWFDKTLQFHLNELGYGGITYEHTPAEGPPLAVLLDFICEQFDLNSFNFASSSADGQWSEPRELQFLLDHSDEEAMRQSAERFDASIKNLEVRSLKFDHFGKNVPKRALHSPDSWIQIALQLAFFRLHGSHPPAYETGSLRMFADGRTDTVRLPSAASKRFVESVAKMPSKSMANTVDGLMEEAIAGHKRYSNKVMHGMGIDRHLLGLQLVAAEHGISVPDLFQSNIYKRLMHFRLSTSQVPTAHILPMGFGPSAPDCYGVCYNPQANRIFFTITAFNECTETCAKRFAEELERALLDMRDLADWAGRLRERAKL
uniref:Choline/carnitine acyltransferase domain-containing protein n=1 Tax=Globodera rostochiensis TaxID=31243 RepID=A0A914HP36_GLORO